MKSNVFMLCLAVFFLIGGVPVSKAQTPKPAKSTVKNLADFVRSANRKNSPTLLTPKDLDAFSFAKTNDAAGGGPCETATAIDIGQQIGNALNDTDCRLDDGSYADFYTFNAAQGQQITLTMSSSSIDSYLGLANESGSFVVEDDDSGGGLTARIAVTLPETGTYIILANSALPNQFGGYTLVLGPAQPCIFSVSPTTANIPAEGGTFTFTVNTQPECYWQAVSVSSAATTNSTGKGTGTVTYTVTQNGTGQTRSGTIQIGSAPLLGVSQGFSFTQPSVSCTYALNPTSVNIPATQTNGTFSIIAPAGCPWTVQTGQYVTANGSGTGNATINYSVAANNGAARVLTITVANQTFTINQAGLNCTFDVSPHQFYVNGRENTGTVFVSTQPGCSWSTEESVTFLDIQNGSGSGSGSFTFRIEPNTESNLRNAGIRVIYQSDSTSVWVEQNKNLSKADFDFDTDRRADFSVFRPSDGTWYIRYSTSNTFTGQKFGDANDVIVPADYDGDGLTDIAVFRPSNGVWYRLNSANNSFAAVQFGTSGDVPVPADYQGDVRAEISVFRPSNGVWYRLNNSNNQVTGVQFGSAGDKPVLGDFDGDGKTDTTIWRPSDGIWYRLNSADNSFAAVQFGTNGDVPTAADFDGDGKTDIAVWRPSDGVWYQNRTTGGFTALQFGVSTDVPVAADYDGDGRADIAVFRPSSGTWYVQRSTAGFASVQFGASGDRPVPSAFVR